MKAIHFLPLAYVADVHGFVLFAPYLLLVMAASIAVRQVARRRARSAGRVPAPAPALSVPPALESALAIAI